MARSAVIGMTVAVGRFGLGMLFDSPPGPVIAGLCVPLLLGFSASLHRGGPSGRALNVSLGQGMVGF